MTRFNVIGFVSGNLGLGVLARAVVRLLLDLGYPVSVIDLDPGLGRAGHDETLASLVTDDAQMLADGINIFVLAAPELRDSLLRFERPLLEGTALNVALPMWELEVFPRDWDLVFSCFDAVAAATPFIRSALERCATPVPIVDAPIPIRFPAPASIAPRRFGLPADATRFYTAFEPYSDPARKNALGAIQAFDRAGVCRSGSILVIKVNNAFAGGREHPALRDLRRVADACGCVRFITDSLDQRTLSDLYGSMDVFLSLHRAEGLGLVPMEAMILSKPVIATGWSGNTAFMSPQSACLVPYELVPVAQGSQHYGRLMRGTDARWADPDLVVAAQWIRDLARDPAARERIGAAAGRAIRAYGERAAKGRFIEELLEMARAPDRRILPVADKRDCLSRISRISFSPTRLGRFRAWLRRRIALR